MAHPPKTNSPLLALLFATLSGLPGCTEPVIDGGGWGDGGGRDDPGDGLQWPDASAIILAAGSPDLARASGGTLLLITSEAGRVMLRSDPQQAEPAAPVDLGPGGGLPRIAVDPGSEQAAVVWIRDGYTLMTAWIDQGEPDGAAFELISAEDRRGKEWSPSRGHSLRWFADGPVLTMISALPQVEVYGPGGDVVERQDPRSDWFAIAVPRPETGTLPQPPESMRLFTRPASVWLGHAEWPTALDLAGTSAAIDGPALLAVSNMQQFIDGEGPFMSYMVGRRSTIGGFPYEWVYNDQSGDTVRLPGVEGGVSWIQGHPLDDGAALLSWCAPSGGMVFDVFVTTMTVADDGTPSLGDQAINVSQTLGLTDHSEAPLVLSAGGGRFWIAWRETSFGPRVALYEADLTRVGIAAPDNELNVSSTAPLGAAVNPDDGALWLAAQVAPVEGEPEVRLWRIEQPE